MRTKLTPQKNIVLETIPIGIVEETCVEVNHTILKSVRPKHVHTGVTKEGLEIIGTGNTEDESLAALEANVLRQRRISR